MLVCVLVLLYCTGTCEIMRMQVICVVRVSACVKYMKQTGCVITAMDLCVMASLPLSG